MKLQGVTVLVLLCVHAAAWAVYPPPLKDDGKFFKPATIEKANAKIREIYAKYHKDVVVETFTSLTAEQEKALKEAGKKKFFDKLAAERVKTLGIQGIYIVITKTPQYLKIDMDAQTRKSGFSNADRTTLQKTITAKLKDEDFDAGLLAGLEFIETTLKSGKK